MASIEAGSASQIQMDYMKLLISQLQNQNPLEPMDNNQMASQLAQFSQLSQLESANSTLSSMNTSFQTVLQATNRNYANSLIGKTVTFFTEDEETGETIRTEGKVKSVFNDPATGDSLLGVTVGEGDNAQEYTLGLGAVLLVRNE